MKFSVAALTAAAVAGLASAAPIVSKPFGLIAIHSGSAVQNSGLVVADDGTLEINASNKNWFSGTFTKDNYVTVGDKYLAVQHDGSIRVGDDKTLLFTDDGNGHLVYGQTVEFTARKAGDSYKVIDAVALDAAPGDISIELRIQY